MDQDNQLEDIRGENNLLEDSPTGDTLVEGIHRGDMLQVLEDTLREDKPYVAEDTQSEILEGIQQTRELSVKKVLYH